MPHSTKYDNYIKLQFVLLSFIFAASTHLPSTYIHFMIYSFYFISFSILLLLIWDWLCLRRILSSRLQLAESTEQELIVHETLPQEDYSGYTEFLDDYLNRSNTSTNKILLVLVVSLVSFISISELIWYFTCSGPHKHVMVMIYESFDKKPRRSNKLGHSPWCYRNINRPGDKNVENFQGKTPCANEKGSKNSNSSYEKNGKRQNVKTNEKCDEKNLQKFEQKNVSLKKRQKTDFQTVRVNSLVLLILLIFILPFLSTILFNHILTRFVFPTPPLMTSINSKQHTDLLIILGYFTINSFTYFLLKMHYYGSRISEMEKCTLSGTFQCSKHDFDTSSHVHFMTNSVFYFTAQFIRCLLCEMTGLTATVAWGVGIELWTFGRRFLL